MTSATDRTDPSVDLGQALGAVLRAYTLAARDVASDVPGGPRGYQILAVATSGDCRNQAGVAEVLGIDRTVMTSLVDGLESAGLVERRPDPADRRARQIVLTAGGRRTLRRVSDRIDDVERDLLAPLTGQEATELRRLLAKVRGPAAPADSGVATVQACTEHG